MPAPEPQDVLTPITNAAMFLTVTVDYEDPGIDDALRDFLSNVSGRKRSVGFRIPTAYLTCVVGIGSELWDRLFGLPRPAGLRPFPEFKGDKHHAPSTPGDLLFHIRASRLDMCFELATLLTDELKPYGQVIDEVHGFKSFNERDLLGFVDGTENPAGEGAQVAVLVGDEDPQFTGGSYVVVQKYLHDMDGWNALSVEEQERAFGRSKLDDVEFPDEDKAANSHLKLNVIFDEDGNQQQIMRFNMPFGRVGIGEFGTYYIGYAHTPDVIERMLQNMFIGNPPGTYDRILDFSTAVTGKLFFVPTQHFIDDPPAPAAIAASESDADASASENGSASPDGSLSIGSLKGGLAMNHRLRERGRSAAKGAPRD